MGSTLPRRQKGISEHIPCMSKVRMLLLQGVVEGKVFIVDMREHAARGIWKSLEQGK